MAELNERQRRFCEQYCLSFNGAEAYQKAGYTIKNAKIAGDAAYQLLKNQDVKDYILQIKMAARHKVEITKERIIEEYRRIAFSETKDFFDETGKVKPIHELSDEASATIAEIQEDEDFLGNTKRKYKRWEKTKALEALGKHLGLFEADNKQKMVFNVKIDD